VRELDDELAVRHAEVGELPLDHPLDPLGDLVALLAEAVGGVGEGGLGVGDLPVEPGDGALEVGGEVSRIMLALKTILAKSERLPILVFDEIDVGISGEIARRVGESMQRLGAYHQIIAITHLPQIAALGDHHFRVEKVVEKGRTKTRIARLGDDERAQEVATLGAGEAVSDAALASARELISAGKRGEG
jgi:hypothetical protein